MCYWTETLQETGPLKWKESVYMLICIYQLRHKLFLHYRTWYHESQPPMLSLAIEKEGTQFSPYSLRLTCYHTQHAWAGPSWPPSQGRMEESKKYIWHTLALSSFVLGNKQLLCTKVLSNIAQKSYNTISLALNCRWRGRTLTLREERLQLAFKYLRIKHTLVFKGTFVNTFQIRLTKNNI